ncbi:MAG: hypothetical protein K9N23_07225 [Akkermansiaceae bacterium]|nr:hypothetical protein [Akkermansiaceae bacterium]
MLRQAASGKRQAASGKRQAASGKRQAASGKRQAASGKRQAASGKRREAEMATTLAAARRVERRKMTGETFIRMDLPEESPIRQEPHYRDKIKKEGKRDKMR